MASRRARPAPRPGRHPRGLTRDGFDAAYDGDLGERQARALHAAGSPIRLDDLRDHTSTWGAPIAIDYRGVRVTTHPPNSSGLVALELIGILGALPQPPADVFGPDGVSDPGWIHAGLEAAKLAIADRDRYLTDPGFRDIPVGALLDPAYLGELASRIDPRRAATPPAATNPTGGGTAFLGVVDDQGNAVSLIASNYLDFGSGVVDPGTGIHYQNRGSYFSLAPDHPNVLEPRKRTLHTLLPGMLFRDAGDGRGPRPWVVCGSMGGDAQPQIHAQLVSALVDGGVDVRTAVAAPRWYVEPRDHFAPPWTSVLSRATGRGSPTVSRPWAIRSSPPDRSTATSGTPTRSSSWKAVPDSPTARWWRPRIHAHTACRPCGDRHASSGDGRAVCDTPATGGRLRSHDAATGLDRPQARATEEPVTSNVGQNYPYSSESEAQRAAVIAGLVAEREGLAGTLAAETTPLDANERWWVWKCPSKGCAGFLHAAGYAAEKHAVYVVCDGVCAKTFLR